MDNFIFQNPVKLIMGHGMIARLSKGDWARPHWRALLPMKWAPI